MLWWKEKRAAKRRREDEESALVLADLQTRLEASEERADEAEAKAEALKTKARMHSARLYDSLARAQKRLDDIEASKTAGASSSIITYSEEEVEEMEGVIGEITKELAELKAVHKHDEVEYERNRSAVATVRSKYRELADLRQQRNKLEAEVQQVKDRAGRPRPRLTPHARNLQSSPLQHQAGRVKARRALRPILRERDRPRDARRDTEADQHHHP